MILNSSPQPFLYLSLKTALSLLLLFPAYFILFPKHTYEVQHIFVLIVFLSCTLLFFFKLKTYSLTLFDILLVLLTVIFLLNFFILSSFKIYYYKFLLYFSFPFVFFLFRNVYVLAPKKDKLHRFFQTLVTIISAIVAVYALLEFWNIIPVNIEYFKVSGGLKNPGLLGCYLSICFLLLINTANTHTLKRIECSLKVVVGILLLVVIVISDSRSAWIGTAVGVIYTVLNSRKFKTFWQESHKAFRIASIFTSILFVVFLSDSLYDYKIDSSSGRWVAAKISSKLIFKSSITGHGAFSFASKYNQEKAAYFLSDTKPWSEIKVANYISSPSNDYLQFIFEFGLIGFFLVMILFWRFSKIRARTNKIICVKAILFSCFVIALFTTIIHQLVLMIVVCWCVAFLVDSNQNELRKFHVVLGKPLRLSLAFIAMSLFTVTALKLYSYYNFKRGHLVMEELILEHQQIAFMIGQKQLRKSDINNGIDLVEQAFFKNRKPEISKFLSNYYIKNGNYNKALEHLLYEVGVEPFKVEPKIRLSSLMFRVNDIVKHQYYLESLIELPVKIPSKKNNQIKSTSKKLLFASKTNKVYDLNTKGHFVKKVKYFDKYFKIDYSIYIPSIEIIEKKIPLEMSYKKIIDENTFKNIIILDSLSYFRKLQPKSLIIVHTKRELISNKHKTDFVNFIYKNYPVNSIIDTSASSADAPQRLNE